MKPTDDLLVFDEDAAVKYIFNFLPKELKKNISEDEIDFVLDVMYEYYEENGMLDENSTEEAEIDENDMFAYIADCIKKNNMVHITDDILQAILDGEFAYGKSIGVYRLAE